MYDRPHLDELLDAARHHMEESIIPAVRADRKLYFQTLVAINVLRIAGRELEHGDAHARAEWQRLSQLMHTDDPLPTDRTEAQAALMARNQQLAEDIRAGTFDDNPRAVFDHLMTSSIEQLEVANPRFLQLLVLEANDQQRDAWHNR